MFREGIRRKLGRAAILVSFTLLIPGVSTQGFTPRPTTKAVSARNLTSLAEGVLLNTAGQPIHGSVTVFLNTLGADKSLRAISVVRAAVDGSFAVPFPKMTNDIKKAASRNGGKANFFLAGGTRNAKSAFSFSAGIARGTWDHSGITQARLVASTGLTQKEKAAASITPSDAPPHIGGVCTYNLEKKRNKDTVVAEFHTSHDTKQIISYGAEENADSEITVGVKVGSHFETSGTVHVGNISSGSTDRTVDANTGYEFRTGFTYGKYRIDPLSYLQAYCWVVPTVIKLATEWIGGISAGQDLSSLDHHCRTNPYRRSWGPGDGFTRDSKNLQWFKAAATVLVFSFDTRSGASENVKLQWRFGTGYQQYWLCGNDSEPTSATRIFAGY